ncbi:MAG: LysR family transcriptional regulator [Alphaproteobacteria bacterium]|nr:MAG: LysR family transcriptional regulator [Alphaproteobacteria bacterium]
MMTLRQLRYLDALARAGHFGRAAELCSVTQPALSMQIQELERSLGLDLVERSRGRVSLTPEGREVVRRARRILNSARDIEDYARTCGKALAGPLRLGVIPSIAPYLLPRILPVLTREYPDASLQLRETQTDVLIGELLSGDLDLLLLALPVDHAEIRTLALFEDRFLLALPASQGLPADVRVSTEFVLNQKLLLLEEGHCLRDQALEYCNMARPELLHSFGATSLATLTQLVANNLGVTLLPELCIEQEGRDPRVALHRFEPPEPSRTIGLAWRGASPRGDAYAALGAVISRVRGEK